MKRGQRLAPLASFWKLGSGLRLRWRKHVPAWGAFALADEDVEHRVRDLCRPDGHTQGGLLMPVRGLL